MSAAATLMRFNLEIVFECCGFFLVRRGQHYGVCWDLDVREMLMIRNITSHQGTRISHPADVDRLLFKTDGELKQAIKDDEHNWGAGNQDDAFHKFQLETLRYLNKED